LPHPVDYDHDVTCVIVNSFVCAFMPACNISCIIYQGDLPSYVFMLQDAAFSRQKITRGLDHTRRAGTGSTFTILLLILEIIYKWKKWTYQTYSTIIPRSCLDVHAASLLDV